MSSLPSVLAIVFVATFILIFQAALWNRKRASSAETVPLFPNCLITRFPIVFLDGPQSVFYFGRFFNDIPKFLTEHGYEVIELDLPWRDREARNTELKRFLDVIIDEGVPCHFFLSSDSLDLIPTLEKLPKAVRSITKIDSKDFTNSNEQRTPFFRRWHEILFLKGHLVDPRALGLVPKVELKSIGRIYLDHCVRLAESDFQLGVQHYVGHTSRQDFPPRAEV